MDNNYNARSYVSSACGCILTVSTRSMSRVFPPNEVRFRPTKHCKVRHLPPPPMRSKIKSLVASGKILANLICKIMRNTRPQSMYLHLNMAEWNIFFVPQVYTFLIRIITYYCFFFFFESFTSHDTVACARCGVEKQRHFYELCVDHYCKSHNI